ncbi:MAG: NAD(P)/FAD-dependent oxidoreductase [Candidatus Magasanikbacteria bacterium]
MHDVIILGGGPAGTAAGVYSARKRMDTLLITKEFGGQSKVSNDIENWIGETHLTGVELAEKLENHVRAYENDSIEIVEGKTATNIEKVDCEDKSRPCDFVVSTEEGEEYRSKAVILATGGHRKRLDVPGEDRLEGQGVAYCATCDAPLFANKTVAVIGGGNAGVEGAIELIPYAEKIYILQRSERLKANPGKIEKVKREDKVEIIYNADTTEILGEEEVKGLLYRDENNEEKRLEVGGVFVEIGSVPNSEIVEGLVEMDDHNQVKIDSKHGTTSQKGIFAAGDVTDDPYKQNNISAGDAVKAAMATYSYIQGLEKSSPAENGKQD